MAETLGIPDGVTQIAMIPVAYTIGTEFKPADRSPVEEVSYLDDWGEPVPGWTGAQPSLLAPERTRSRGSSPKG